MLQFVAMLLCVAAWHRAAFCEELPDAPVVHPALIRSVAPSARGVVLAASQRKPGKVTTLDKSLWAADFTARMLDVHSTRRFLTAPCHCYNEGMMPKAMVDTAAGMIAWETGITGSLAWTDRYMIRHHHGKLAWGARAALLTDTVLVTRSAIGNYTFMKTSP